MEKSNGEIEPDGIRNVNGDMQGQDEIGIASDDGETHELTYERRNGFVRYDKSLKNLIPIRRKKRDDGTLGVDSAGLVSTFTFSWLTKILYDAHNKGIKMDELPALSPFDGGTYNARRLELMWEEELARKGPEKASFSNVTWRFCRTRILATCVIFIGSLIASLVCYTYLMQRLLEYVQSSDESYTEGAKWVLLLIIVGIIRTFLFSGCLSMCFRTALRLRSACLTFLYAKIIRLDNLGNKNIGKVINTFSNDAQKIFDMILVAPLVVGAPISTAFGIAYILWLLGPMALIGMIALFLFFPMQYVISQVTDYFQTKAVEISDMRVRVIGEILDCIKLIKMYAWEKRFSDELLGLREKEGRNLLKTTYLWTLCFSISPAFPVISAIMTFIIHASIGNNLLASQVFPWKTFLDSGISLTLLLFQEGIGCIIPGRISIDRIKSLLLLEKGNCVITKPIVKSQALAITNGTFAYDTFDDQETEGTQSNGKKRDNEAINSGEKSEQETLNKPTEKADCVEVLFDVSFEAEKGKLIGICGTVGSGKSSLLLAALGQLRILEGQVTRDGSCAYVSQQAWISNATLRENILFGAKFDRSRYDKTIYACNLSQDIDMMPGGDQTEIGEKGINLSGGQKQRVALARALYADRDIYLLDDPLSAVDACVGSYLFDNLILGALRGKTVLFVTHQIQYLNRCDEIYMMRDGKIMERGTHEELMKLGNEYALMVAAISTDDDSEEEIIVDKIITDIPETIETIPPHEKKRSIVSSVGSRVSVKSIENVNTTDALLTVAEDIQDGSVKADTYHSYIMAAGGYCTLIIVILTFLTSATSIAFGSWWLAFWIDAGGGNTTIVRDNETIISDNVHDNPNFSYYRTIYASTIGVILITCAVRCYIYSKATIRASTKMHNDLFKKVITSPMRFFDTTPSGRIQHLFSRDMDEVDNKLPVSLMVVVDNGIRVFFCFVVICVVFPWFLLPLCILAVLYYYIAKVFRTGIRDLKRMDNKARTVLISFATASIQGLSTIHAFGKESEFMTKFTKLFDENSKFLFMYNGALRWLSVRIDGLSVVITGITAMLMVILKGEISPALAGLALTYAMLISDICQSTVKLLTETEVRLINVERLNTYAKTLVSESNMSRPPTVQPRPTWPEAAEIKFINVCMAYGENAPLILKNVSFSIGAGEKIGIVGRTGSGKSSLTVALFRLVELAEGKIEIDDVDISDISHSQLRSKLSIIPQDPVLFSGTIRSNLDPFKLYTDAEIWEALEKTELKSRVQSIAGQLDATVGFGGDNISVGERQLLCLSRALLRNSKILVLDEATAAVDPETEIAVQKTIQEEFSHCTILTIAHRLQTVLSLNRILVMDSGRVLEFDTPSNLLEDSNSMFSKMIAAAEKAEGQ